MSTQLTLPIDIDEQRNFDDFVETPNVQLVEHLKYQLDQLIASPRPRYHGALIWGASSAGKTHLMLALASLFKQGGGRVQWLQFAQGQYRLCQGEPKLLTIVDDIEHFTQDSAAEQAKDELTPPEAAEEPEKETAQVDPFEEPSPQQIEALNILGDYVALAKR